MSADVSVTLSVVEGSHVKLISALREMSRQARHDRYHSYEDKNLCKPVHLCYLWFPSLNYHLWQKILHHGCGHPSR